MLVGAGGHASSCPRCSCVAGIREHGSLLREVVRAVGAGCNPPNGARIPHAGGFHPPYDSFPCVPRRVRSANACRNGRTREFMPTMLLRGRDSRAWLAPTGDRAGCRAGCNPPNGARIPHAGGFHPPYDSFRASRVGCAPRMLVGTGGHASSCPRRSCVAGIREHGSLLREIVRAVGAGCNPPNGARIPHAGGFHPPYDSFPCVPRRVRSANACRNGRTREFMPTMLLSGRDSRAWLAPTGDRAGCRGGL